MPRNIVLIILLLSLVFSIYINDYTQPLRRFRVFQEGRFMNYRLIVGRSA